MPQPITYFLGCNTPDGYFSLFPQFTEPAAGWRCILIKGGPGTGKSTLMKRVAAHCRRRGCDVEEIHCASDCDSLDGVVLPGPRIVLLDATPPHALEPRCPGAVEQPLSLCDCWDEEALRSHRDEIVALSEEIAAHHRQAVRYLGSAAALLREVRQIADRYTDHEKILRYAHSLAERELPDRGGKGAEQQRLLSAVTNKGAVLWNGTLEVSGMRMLCIEDPYGATAPAVIAALRQEALLRGYRIITCPCAVSPREKYDHLLIPEAGLGFVTANRFHPVTAQGRAIHAQRFTDMEAMKQYRVRVRFLQKAAEMLLTQAAEAMAAAKDRHDALEQYYRSATDFSRIDSLTQEFLHKLNKLL